MEDNTSTILKANTPNEVITKEEYERRVREIVKCKRDIVYFANTYFKILSMKDGIRTINLYPKQEDLLKFFKNEKRAICLSARQSGKSSMYTIYLLWLCCFFPEKKAMLLANKAVTAVELVGRIQLAYEYLPVWLKPKILIWNKGQLMFSNRSEIRAFSSSSDAARGFSCNCVTGDTIVTVSIDENIYSTEISNVESLLNKKFKVLEILTENGFKQFAGIRISETEKLFELTTNKGKTLKCTAEHKIKTDDGSFVEAKSLLVGTFLSIGEKIVDKKELNGKFNVYDALNVEDGNEYLTNGITSHNCLVLDEFAFLPKHVADKLFTSIYPVISSSPEGKIIIVSTPNGTADNLYYDLWQQANSKTKNDEGWKPFEMHWWDVPGRDEKFKEMTIASIGQKRWDQEFACEFLSPSDFRRLIPEDILEKHKMRLDQFKLQGEAKGREMQIVSQDETKVFNFTMWECFDPNKTYLASGDVAEGTGGDSSVLDIWDVTDLSKISLVCKFADNECSVLEFAYVSKCILELYANPPLIVENNSIGSSYLDVLRINYEYDNIVQEGGKNNPWGIRSHSTIKPKACLWTRDMFTTQGFDWIIKDGDLLKEIGTFVKKEGSGNMATYSAMGNAHDDLVMSLIWGAYLLQLNLAEKYFVVVEYFTSSLGVTYPKILKPGLDYTQAELKVALESPYYKDFQESVVEKRKEKKQSEEKAKELIEKERQLKNLERKIRSTDYSKQIVDPFNPMNNAKEENNQSFSVPGFIVGGEGRYGSQWGDADFEGDSWGSSWR